MKQTPKERSREKSTTYSMQKPRTMQKWDVLILGAGASGLACAAHCIEAGLSVCLVDRAREPGRKLNIAGGGHANFTNRTLSPSQYRCNQTDFVQSTLRAFGSAAAIRFIEGLGLTWEQREKGKLFLRNDAKELTKALLTRCRTGRFSLRMEENFRKEDIHINSMGVSLLGRYQSRNLVLALGSPAFPSSGASGLGYAIAESFGHSIIPPVAALTPLLLPEASTLYNLQGLSVPVKIATGDFSCVDDLLFTHDAISGPAALKASLFWENGKPLTIDFLPEQRMEEILSDKTAGKGTPRSLLQRFLPKALVDALLPEDIRARRVAELSRKVRTELCELVHHFSFVPPRNAGLKKAEVCRGGVNTEEVYPDSFQSKKEKKLFIIGELLDVTGLLGGYNLHWAFASAMRAAEALSKALRSHD